MRVILSVLVVSILVACNSKSDSDAEPESANVLKEYVDAPKERARGAKDKVEAAQSAVQRQADIIGGE